LEENTIPIRLVGLLDWEGIFLRFLCALFVCDIEYACIVSQ